MPFRFLTHDDFRSDRALDYARGLFCEGLALFGDFGAGLGRLGRSPLEPADRQQQDQREGGQRGDKSAGLGHFGYAFQLNSQCGPSLNVRQSPPQVIGTPSSAAAAFTCLASR